MIMEKGKIYIGIGLILNSLGALLRNFEIFLMAEYISCFLQGFLTGLGIVLIFYGFYYEKYNWKNNMNFKKQIFNKMLKK